LVLPFLISSSLMIVGVIFVENLFNIDSTIFSLLIAIIFGAIFYSAISVLFVMMLRLKYSEFDFVYKTFFIPLYRLIFKRVVVR
ncbi:hypothetical protein, partial [Tenacibaculum sp.]|uniref:hypothetical protein n=1 Tax=Tenacibaculum sp. TaxID=1906242 RepID=UPI003AA87BAA